MQSVFCVCCVFPFFSRGWFFHVSSFSPLSYTTNKHPSSISAVCWATFIWNKQIFCKEKKKHTGIMNCWKKRQKKNCTKKEESIAHATIAMENGWATAVFLTQLVSFVCVHFSFIWLLIVVCSFVSGNTKCTTDRSSYRNSQNETRWSLKASTNFSYRETSQNIKFNYELCAR